MENSSNALIMAAGILISVIIISIGTYMFTSYRNYSNEINNRLNENQKEEFNTQFTKYEGENCSVYDVVTVINNAKDVNEKKEYKENETLYIEIKGNTGVDEKSKIEELNEFIKDNKDNKFKCLVDIDENVGLVTKVTFTKK